jgi:uncharacterized protein (DUF1499 family)
MYCALHADVDVSAAGEEAACATTITSGLHDGPISDLAVCAEQPLIVSCCSADSKYNMRARLIAAGM